MSIREWRNCRAGVADAYLLLILTSIAIIACGCRKQDRFSDAAVDTTYVQAVHTITSIQIDDNYGFAEIVDLCFCPDSTIITVDSKLVCIRRYSASGEYLQSYGSIGQGPGEFIEPHSAAVCGRILLVSDVNGLNGFDVESGAWLFLKDEYTRPMLLKMVGIDSTGTIAALTSNVVFSGQTPCRIAEYRTFNLNENQPVDVFWRDSSVVDFADSEYLRICMEQPIVASDIDGNIYVSESTESMVRITKYSPSGEILLCIEDKCEPVSLSADEKQEEYDYYSWYTERMGLRATYTPPDAWPAVTSLGIDSNSRIWARIGGSNPPAFRLYSQQGILTGIACLEDSPTRARYLDVRVTPWGIAGFSYDPEQDYPQVSIFRIRE